MAGRTKGRGDAVGRRLGEPLRGLSDRIDETRLLLLGDVDDAAERALARYGRDEGFEARLAERLAEVQPLAEPAFFLAAHRNLVHALEVLDSEGAANARTPNLGPLSGLFDFVVEAVGEYVVRSFERRVIARLAKLYSLREVQCPHEAPERTVLARARIEVNRLSPAFHGGGIDALALIAGGASVSLLASVFRFFGALKLDDAAVLVPVMVVLFLLNTWLSSALLYGASTARQRIRFLVATPLAELWQVVGNSGHPPDDNGGEVATVAVVITVVAFLALPAVALWASLA
jgi:hypothetical protein